MVKTFVKQTAWTRSTIKVTIVEFISITAQLPTIKPNKDAIWEHYKKS